MLPEQVQNIEIFQSVQKNTVHPGKEGFGAVSFPLPYRDFVTIWNCYDINSFKVDCRFKYRLFSSGPYRCPDYQESLPE
jgi:hypothetical protein